MVRGARPTGRCTCCRRCCIHQQSGCPVHRLRVREDVRQFTVNQHEVGPRSCLTVVLTANSSLEVREVILRPQIVTHSFRRCLPHKREFGASAGCPLPYSHPEIIASVYLTPVLKPSVAGRHRRRPSAEKIAAEEIAVTPCICRGIVNTFLPLSDRSFATAFKV